MARLRLTPLRVAVLVAAGVLAGAGAAYAATLPIVSAQLWAGKQTLTKATCALGASAADDTWVNESSQNQANGGGSTLSVASKRGSRGYAFIRFDARLLRARDDGRRRLGDALAHVTGTTKTNHTISLYPVYSSWSGDSLTWNSLGSLTIGPSATASFTTSTGAKSLTVTADLDAAIRAGALWGWELVDTGGPGNATTTIAAAGNGTPSKRPSLSVSGAQ